MEKNLIRVGGKNDCYAGLALYERGKKEIEERKGAEYDPWCLSQNNKEVKKELKVARKEKEMLKVRMKIDGDLHEEEMQRIQDRIDDLIEQKNGLLKKRLTLKWMDEEALAIWYR